MTTVTHTEPQPNGGTVYRTACNHLGKRLSVRSVKVGDEVYCWFCERPKRKRKPAELPVLRIR